MQYANHIKNKNDTGFTVNGVPFLKLSTAEQYCRKNDIIIDENNLTYNPEEAKRIALMLYPEYDRLVGIFEDRYNQVICDVKTEGERKKVYIDSKTIHGDIEAEMCGERIREGIGRVDAMSIVLDTLRNRRYELYEIIRTAKNGEIM